MTTQIVEYSATETGLAELHGRLAGVVYDVSKPAELDRARADRRECVKLRTSLETLRKSLKESVLERGRAIDGEAKRITSSILEVEEPIDAQVKAEESRKEREKAAKEQADREAAQAIRAKISEVRDLLVQAADLDHEGVERLHLGLFATLDDKDWLKQFGPFDGEATTARDTTIVTLAHMHQRKLESALEAQRLKDAAAKLAEERAAFAAEQRAAHARHEQELAAAAERMAQEAAIARAAQAAAETTARIAREKADAEAKAAREEADRVARVAREAAERQAADERAEAARVLQVAKDAQARQEAEEAARKRVAQEAELAELTAAVYEYTKDPRLAHVVDLVQEYDLATTETEAHRAMSKLLNYVSSYLPRPAAAKKAKAA